DLEGAALGQGIEPEHLEQLASDRGTFPLPTVQAADVRQAPRGYLRGGLLQMLHNPLVPAGRILLAVDERWGEQDEPDQDRQDRFHRRSFASDAFQVRNSARTSSREQRSR